MNPEVSFYDGHWCGKFQREMCVCWQVGNFQKTVHQGSITNPCLRQSVRSLRVRSFNSLGPWSQRQHQISDHCGVLQCPTGGQKHWFLTSYYRQTWRGMVQCSNPSETPPEGSQFYAQEQVRQKGEMMRRRESSFRKKKSSKGRAPRASPKNYRGKLLYGDCRLLSNK